MILSRNSRFHTLSPNNCLKVPRRSENASYSFRWVSLTRASPFSANFEKNFCACSSLPMCTNANCVPVAAISERFFRISAIAATQNGHPKCRRKTSRTGVASLSAARVVPSCVMAFARASGIVVVTAVLGIKTKTFEHGGHGGHRGNVKPNHGFGRIERI